MKTARVISHYRLVFAFFALLAILGFTQPVLADFYVVPIGGPRISASDVVELQYSEIYPNSSATNDMRITKSGGIIHNFTVPTGKVLVITTIKVYPQVLGNGSIALNVLGGREYFVVSQSQPTQLQFPSGLVIGPEVQLSVYNYPGSAASIRVSICGYLADDK
jgi:hypothetical protein